MFSGNFLSDATPLQLACPCRKDDSKKCKGSAAIRTPPFTQAGLATWVVCQFFRSLNPFGLNQANLLTLPYSAPIAMKAC